MEVQNIFEENTMLQVRNISKRFVIQKNKSIKERLLNPLRSRANRENFTALNGISFDLPFGMSLGLLGHNGSGKSTLLKIIGGIISANSGTVAYRGRPSALLELGAGFHPDLSGRENIYVNASILGLSKAEIDRCFEPIVEFSGIREFIETQVKFYSSGMYVRLAFSVAVHVDPELLIVDEVIAVGDEAFRKKCMSKIQEFRKEGRNIIMVSHEPEEIRAVCDRVLVLKNGRIIFDGDTEPGLEALHASFESSG